MARNMIDDVPVGTIQVDEILPDKSKLTRTISGIGTPNITRNYTPQGTINQDVVNEGAARIAASRQAVGPTAQELQERLTRLMPDTIAASRERLRLRSMSDYDRSKEIEDIELANRVNESLGITQPKEEQAKPARRKVNIADATGPTLDMGPQNTPAMSQQAKAFQAKATREFTEEFGRKLASTDKSAWQTEEDYNAFVNSLDATKKYGDVIAGTIYHYATSIMPAELKQKFEVTRMNQDSFTSWMGDTFKDFDQNGIPDTAAVIFHAAKQGDAEAARMVNEWKTQSDAPVYVLGPEGKIVPDPYKMAQVQQRIAMGNAQEEARLRMQIEADKTKARRESDFAASKELWDKSPQLQAAYPLGVGPYGDFIQSPKTEDTMGNDIEAMTNLEQQIAQIDAQDAIAAMPEAEYQMALKGITDQKTKDAYQAARTRSESSKALTAKRKAILERKYTELAAKYEQAQEPGATATPAAPTTREQLIKELEGEIGPLNVSKEKPGPYPSAGPLFKEWKANNVAALKKQIRTFGSMNPAVAKRNEAIQKQIFAYQNAKGYSTMADYEQDQDNVPDGAIVVVNGKRFYHVKA